MFIDICLLALLTLALFKGMKKGLVVAAFSFFAVIIGLAAAVKMSALVATWLSGTIQVAAKWLPFLAFICIMVATSFAVKIGAKLVETALQFSMLGWVNKLGGVLLFTFLYFSVFSVIVFYMAKLHILQPTTIQSSKGFPIIQFWGPEALQLIGKIIPIFKGMFDDLNQFFDGLSNKLTHK